MMLDDHSPYPFSSCGEGQRNRLTIGRVVQYQLKVADRCEADVDRVEVRNSPSA